MQYDHHKQLFKEGDSHVQGFLLSILQIKSMDQIEGAEQRPGHQRRPSSGKQGSYLQLRPDAPGTSIFSDITKHSE